MRTPVLLLGITAMLEAAGPVGPVGPEAPATGARIEIQSFRFSKDKARRKERLVLEFTRKDTGTETPTAKVGINEKTKETQIEIQGAQLASPIPASVNDTFSATSQLLGSVNQSSDLSPNGFFLKTAKKEESAIVDAFWLTNPLRLVIDVYRKKSDLKSLEAMTTGASTALRLASAEPKKQERQAADENSARTERKNKNRYYCFPASAQVAMSVVFEPVTPTEGAQDYKVDVKAKAASSVPDDQVVCYPAETRLAAHVTFKENKPMSPPALPGSPEAGTAQNQSDASTERTTASKESPFLWNGGITSSSPAAPSSSPPAAKSTSELSAAAGDDSRAASRSNSRKTPAPEGLLTPMK